MCMYIKKYFCFDLVFYEFLLHKIQNTIHYFFINIFPSYPFKFIFIFIFVYIHTLFIYIHLLYNWSTFSNDVLCSVCHCANSLICELRVFVSPFVRLCYTSVRAALRLDLITGLVSPTHTQARASALSHLRSLSECIFANLFRAKTERALRIKLSTICYSDACVRSTRF